MLSDTGAAALRDIEHHINLAAEFVAGLGYEAFRDDTRTVYAVTRCLEIISEASRRLPDEIKARHPSIAWRDMAGAGGQYLPSRLTRMIPQGSYGTRNWPCHRYGRLLFLKS
jgi:Protein of unknown function DUF86